MNFFKHKVLFRCDAADIPEIGTGHLYRCLTIARLLKKKFRLKNKDIAFLVKSKNHYKKSLKILSYYKFKVIKINLLRYFYLKYYINYTIKNNFYTKIYLHKC